MMNFIKSNIEELKKINKFKKDILDNIEELNELNSLNRAKHVELSSELEKRFDLQNDRVRKRLSITSLRNKPQ